MENYQNTYRYVTSYIEIFSCVFMHEFYQKSICADVVFTPTSRTTQLLKNFNLILKSKVGGFVLAANAQKDYSSSIFKDPFSLDFEFKFTNRHFHSFTSLINDPEVRYFLDDDFSTTVNLGPQHGTIDAELDRPGLSGILRIKHVLEAPLLPLFGEDAGKFRARKKEVILNTRMIRPVYICYTTEDSLASYQGMGIEKEGEFKGVVEFDPPEMTQTSSGMNAFKFVSKNEIPMKDSWKGYFLLYRSNQLGVYKKTLPNPSPQSIKFDFTLNSYISENFVKL